MKKYECISDYFHEEQLTVGKIYQGELKGDYVKVRNDNGYFWSYYAPFYFKELSDEN